MAYRTKDELLTNLTSVFASAKPGKITASDLRGFFTDLIDSSLNINWTNQTGSMIQGQTSGLAAQFALGENGKILTSVSGVASWQFPSSGNSSDFLVNQIFS